MKKLITFNIFTKISCDSRCLKLTQLQCASNLAEAKETIARCSRFAISISNKYQKLEQKKVNEDLYGQSRMKLVRISYELNIRYQ